MKTLAHIAAKLVDTPLLIHPPKLDAILAAIGPRVGLEIPIEAQAQLAPAERHACDVTEDGIAVIPVQGTLMKKAYGLWATSGSDSYELLAEQIQRAAEDSSIQGVLLDIDSPRGTGVSLNLPNYFSDIACVAHSIIVPRGSILV